MDGLRVTSRSRPRNPCSRPMYHKVERMRAFISGIDQQAMINKQIEQTEEAEEDKRHLRTQESCLAAGNSSVWTTDPMARPENPKSHPPLVV